MDFCIKLLVFLLVASAGKTLNINRVLNSFPQTSCVLYAANNEKNNLDFNFLFDDNVMVQWITNHSTMEKIVGLPFEVRSTIVLDFNDIGQSLSILASASQHNLIHSHWIILSARQSLDFVYDWFPSRKQLSPMSKIFIVNETNATHQILGIIQEQPKIKVLFLQSI